MMGLSLICFFLGYGVIMGKFLIGYFVGSILALILTINVGHNAVVKYKCESITDRQAYNKCMKAIRNDL